MESFGEIRFELGRGDCGFEACAERVDSQFTELGEFFAANGYEFGFRLRRDFGGWVGGLGWVGDIAHAGFAVTDGKGGGKLIVVVVG